MPLTKKAIATQPIRTKLHGLLVETGAEFEDFTDRIDDLIKMDAAKPIGDKPVVDQVEEQPQAGPGGPNIDAIVTTIESHPDQKRGFKR
jgi:hypothetical protein